MKKRELLSTRMTDEQKTKVHEILPEFFDGENSADEKFKISVESIDEPESLYHYTSINTLEKILTQSIRKEYLILRSTHFEYLNDYQELNLAIDEMRKVAQKFEEDGKDKENKELSKYLDHNNWKRIMNLFELLNGPYITSFSENSDSLPMWNMYGNNGNGVALGFQKIEPQHLDNERKRLKNCLYDTESFKDLFTENFQFIYDNVNINGGNLAVDGKLALNELAFIFGTLKHKAFEFEKEWRLMKQVNIERNAIKFHSSNGILKPFIENKFQKSDLKKIVIGPCADKELSKRSIEMLLHNAGFSLNKKDENFVEVLISKAPYRII